MPFSLIASSARRAEDALAYLQKTMPFDAMRSDLQYCRLLKRAISSCAVMDCLPTLDFHVHSGPPYMGNRVQAPQSSCLPGV